MNLISELTSYSNSILSGEIKACQKHKWACQRFLNDIERSGKDDPDFPYYFNEEKAERFFNWMRLFKHRKGVLKGKKIDPVIIQKFIFGNVYGWYSRLTGYRRFNKMYWQVARKNSKALSLDTPIPTPDGWKLMADISPGDFIFDDGGSVCSVVEVSEIFQGHDCYRVGFSDGSFIVADAGHLWKTESRRTGRIKGKRFTEVDFIHSTEDIYKTLRVDSPYNIKHDRIEWNHRVKLSLPLILPDRDLLIPPYALGCWLGDGHSQDAGFTCGIKDAEILENIAGFGVTVRRRLQSTNNNAYYCYLSMPIDDNFCRRWHPKSKHWNEKTGKCRVCESSASATRRQDIKLHHGKNVSFCARLKSLGLLGDKHIPNDYLRSSIEQRRQLLRGLMDTDGTISKSGQCSYCSTSKRLAYDVVELLCSLGFKPSVDIDIARCNGKDCGLAYRIQFWAYQDTPVFMLRRKLKRQKQKPLKPTRSACRQIISVDKIDSVVVKCLQVDSKNHLFLAGKSMIPTHNSQSLACVGTYETMAFDETAEEAAETYVAATKTEQARIVYDEAVAMLNGNKDLRGKYTVAYGRIMYNKTGSIMRALSEEDRKTGDGLNPQCGIIDEYHAHETSEIFDVIETGMGARAQPLLAVISTAGFELTNPCYRIEYDLCSKILNPDNPIKIENYFVMINELDRNDTGETIEIDGRKIPEGELIDDIRDESIWVKANPIICSYPEGIDYLRKRLKEALEVPEKMRNFLTKHMDIWVNQRESGYMNLGKWAACGATITRVFPDLTGLKVYPGVDLSSTIDLTSVTFICELPEENYAVISHSFIPEEKLTVKRKTDKVPYDLWVKQGWITATNGAEVSYHQVLKYIEDQYEKYHWNKGEFCYDKALATWFKQTAEERGFIPIEVPQTFTSLSTATKWFRAKVYNLKIIHDNNPVLSWAMGNAVTRTGPSENILLDKGKAKDRIDPVSAAMNASTRAMANEIVETIYNKRGMKSLMD